MTEDFVKNFEKNMEKRRRKSMLQNSLSSACLLIFFSTFSFAHGAHAMDTLPTAELHHAATQASSFDFSQLPQKIMMALAPPVFLFAVMEAPMVISDICTEVTEEMARKERRKKGYNTE